METRANIMCLQLFFCTKIEINIHLFYILLHIIVVSECCCHKFLKLSSHFLSSPSLPCYRLIDLQTFLLHAQLLL